MINLFAGRRLAKSFENLSLHFECVLSKRAADLVQTRHVPFRKLCLHDFDQVPKTAIPGKETIRLDDAEFRLLVRASAADCCALALAPRRICSTIFCVKKTNE